MHSLEGVRADRLGTGIACEEHWTRYRKSAITVRMLLTGGPVGPCIANRFVVHMPREVSS